MRVFRGISELKGNTALAVGNFDGMHLAHQKILKNLTQKAREKNLSPSVLTFRPNPKAFFQPQNSIAPLMRLNEKLLFFKNFEIENVVVCPFNASFAEQSPEEFLSLLKNVFHTQMIFIGDDFRFGKNRAGNAETLKKFGFTVEKTEELNLNGERVSSSAIRFYLKNGEMKKAAELLGRDFSICGRVQKGQKLGRALGFATANMVVPFCPLPLQGVFAVKAQIENEKDFFYGVANVGTRPTVLGVQPLLEAHLFDFERNIYQKRLRVYFQHFLRKEKHFASLTDLQNQIGEDAKNARDFFYR